MLLARAPSAIRIPISADLAGHGVGEHAVDAEDGESERERGEAEEDARVELRKRGRLAKKLVEASNRERR